MKLNKLLSSGARRMGDLSAATPGKIAGNR